MNEQRAARLVLAFLAASAALPGAWASLSPQGFFDDFPAIGSWVAALPLYNEHLTRDAGAFHVLNLEPFTTADAVMQTVTLGAVLLAPLAVLRWA